MPVEDRSRLTSDYGYQAWRGYTHNGTDFGGPSPGVSTKVFAVADGVVTIAWDATVPKNSGKVIKVEHPDGSATIYVHTRNPRVKRGQKVERGEWIAETWTTGLSASAGIHLHLTWLKNANDYNSHFNPISRLADYGWVVKDGRLVDEWEGRATKSGSTNKITVSQSKPAPTTTTAKPAKTTPTKESTLSAEEVKEIKEYIDKSNTALYDRLLAGIKWAKIGYKDESLRELLSKASSGAQAGYSNTVQIKSANVELTKALAEASASSGLTPDQITDLVVKVSEAAERGAEKGMAEGFDVNVKAEVTKKDSTES